MNFLVIGGAGAIGKERISALLKLKEQGWNIGNIYSYDPKHANNQKGVMAINENFIIFDKIDWVFIATPHHVVNDWVEIVSQWGSKILIEKPLGRNYEEARLIFSHSPNIYVGFNYRFHMGIQRLREDILSNTFGKIISINMILGHGGKPEDKDSWKLDSIKGAPDALLDPGIHFLDLLNFFFPRRAIPQYCKSWSGFWGTGIKEEIHLILDINGFPVNLQSSIVKWRNTYRIEINGTEGYGIVEGRGKNYGLQSYHRGNRWGWQNGKSQRESEELVTIDDCENSFYYETKSLLFGGSDNCDSIDALDTMKLYSDSIGLLK